MKRRAAVLWLLAVAFVLIEAVPLARAADLPGGVAKGQEYSATIRRVIDGDTLRVNVDAWDGLTVDATVRLWGVNAPETRSLRACERAAGAAAKAFVEKFVAGQTLALTVIGREKYGRVLGRVSVGAQDLGAALIDAGHAKPYQGERRGAWC